MPALMAVKKVKGKTLSPEKMRGIFESLFENGYYNINGSLNILADYIDYKAFLQIEEFQNDKGHRIILEFIKEFINGRLYYHIKEVNIS